MSVDVRTRIDGDAAPLDPESFFADLPAVLDDAATRLGPAMAILDPHPLTIDVDGTCWTLAVGDGAARVAPGRNGDGTLRIGRDQLADLVHDQVTPMGWFSAGELNLDGASLENVLDWWLVLRAALDDRAPYVPGDVDFTTPDGQPLDLRRSFRSDEPIEEMRAFLAETGFLHIEGVFREDEMAAVSADMDAAAPRYQPGDKRSWWATLADGTDRVVRLQGFDDESPATADLVADDRFQGLRTIPGDGHEWVRWQSSNRIEALFKPVGVRRGISDVPWHKDCSLGRHSYDCCGMTVGISVTGADDRSGQLSVVAGSHRAHVWPAPVLQPGLDLPVIDLPTRTGDITVHLSCTLHMAHPPVDRERRVMYSSFSLPPVDPTAAAAARARLGTIRETASVTVSQPASTS